MVHLKVNSFKTRYAEVSADSISSVGLACGEFVAIDDDLPIYLANFQYVSSSMLRKNFLRRNAGIRNVEPYSDSGALFHNLALQTSDRIECQCLSSKYKKFSAQKNVSSNNLLNALDQLRTWHDGIFYDWVDEGTLERSLYWRDEIGVRWKARPDLVTSGAIVELKTFSGRNQKRFLKHPQRQGYLIQAGLYLHAYQELFDQELDFIFICVDLNPPFKIQANSLTCDERKRALDLVDLAKKAYLCLP